MLACPVVGNKDNKLSYVEKTAYCGSSPCTQIWRKIDPYYQWQKCSPCRVTRLQSNRLAGKSCVENSSEQHSGEVRKTLLYRNQDCSEQVPDSTWSAASARNRQGGLACHLQGWIIATFSSSYDAEAETCWSVIQPHPSQLQDWVLTTVTIHSE